MRHLRWKSSGNGGCEWQRLQGKIQVSVGEKGKQNFYDAIYIGSKDDEEKTPLVMGWREKDLEKFTFEVPSSMAGEKYISYREMEETKV